MKTEEVRNEEKEEKLIEWIKRNLVPRKTKNKHVTSYTLKHLFQGQAGVYVTDREFQEAMFKCGLFPVSYSISGSAYYAISEKSLAFRE